MTLSAQTVRPVGQAAIGRNVVGLTVALCVFIVLWSDASVGQLGGLDDIYTTRAVVTGKDERNRPLLRESQFTTNRGHTTGLIF